MVLKIPHQYGYGIFYTSVNITIYPQNCEQLSYDLKKMSKKGL